MRARRPARLVLPSDKKAAVGSGAQSALAEAAVRRLRAFAAIRQKSGHDGRRAATTERRLERADCAGLQILRQAAIRRLRHLSVNLMHVDVVEPAFGGEEDNFLSEYYKT